MTKPKIDDFTLEQDVSIPPRTRSGHRNSKYQWHRYLVDESHFYPGLTSSKLSGSLSRYRQMHGGKWTVRSVVENEVTGTRVWRTA